MVRLKSLMDIRCGIYVVLYVLCIQFCVTGLRYVCGQILDYSLAPRKCPTKLFMSKAFARPFQYPGSIPSPFAFTPHKYNYFFISTVNEYKSILLCVWVSLY
jgi:hypothetical protein